MPNWFLLTLLSVVLLLITACTSNQSNPQIAKQAAQQTGQHASQIEISPDRWLQLPTPDQLGYSIFASQIITVHYQQTKHQLPIQLQVDSQRVALAGFSSWGSPLLSLNYQDGKIDSKVMIGLSSQLPEPKQVLFNLMLTLWPISAWKSPLDQIGWQLVENTQPMSEKIGSSPSPTRYQKHRQLFDEQGKAIVDIYYQHSPDLNGVITYINHPLKLEIEIATLKYQS